MLLAEGKEAAVMLQHRCLIALLHIHGAQLVFDRNRQPGFCSMRKACLLRMVIPHHRRAAAIAALEFRPELNAVGILQIGNRQYRLRQPQFLALIDADGTALGEQDGSRSLV